MFWITTILLCGVSFAPLLIKKPDIWHAQGIFVQCMILIMLCWSFFEKPKNLVIKNVPLGLLLLWVGLQTTYLCWRSQVAGVYDVKHFFLFFNFLCLIIFYNLVIQYLAKEDIERILNWLRRVIILTLIVCVLQKFRLFEFFYLLIEDPSTPKEYSSHNNPVFGFLGNGTHLSGFLASTIPLFLWHGKREDWLALLLMGGVMCYTGTTIGQPAISGWIVAVIVYFYFIKKNNTALIITIIMLFMSIPFILDKFPKDFFAPTGRIPLWVYYFKEVFSKRPIQGFGLGSFNMIYSHTPFPNARHLHLEYFHYIVEIGIMGIILIINMINSFFHIKAEDKLDLCLKGCALGFLVSCCFNYPSHLWLPSSWAMFFYAAYLSIKRRDVLWV